MGGKESKKHIIAPGRVIAALSACGLVAAVGLRRKHRKE